MCDVLDIVNYRDSQQETEVTEPVFLSTPTPKTDEIVANLKPHCAQAQSFLVGTGADSSVSSLRHSERVSREIAVASVTAGALDRPLLYLGGNAAAWGCRCLHLLHDECPSTAKSCSPPMS